MDIGLRHELLARPDPEFDSSAHLSVALESGVFGVGGRFGWFAGLAEAIFIGKRFWGFVSFRLGGLVDS